MLRVLGYILTYFKGIMFSLMVVDLFGLLTIALVDTSLEKIFIAMLSITPGIGLGRRGTFNVDSKNIVLFFIIWGAILAPIKIRLNYKQKFLVATILHLLVMLVLSARVGPGFSLFLVVSSFIIFNFALAFYELLKYVSIVNNITDKSA